MPLSAEPRALRLWHLLVLGLVLAIAGAVRFAECRRGSLVPDEIWTVMLSTGRGSVHLNTPDNVLLPAIPATTSHEGASPWWKVPFTFEGSVYPPAYQTLLALFRATVSPTDLAARYFTAVLSLVAIAIFFDAFRLLLSPGPALWATAILAFSRPAVEVGTEVRPYALLILGSALVFDGVARFMRGGCGGVLMLAAGSLVMLFTHYFALGFLLCAGIGCLWVFRGRTRRSAALAIAVPTLAFFMVWGPVLHRQTSAGRLSERDDANEFLLRGDPSPTRMATSLLTLPARLLYVPKTVNEPAALALGLVWLIPLLGGRQSTAARLLGLLAVGGILTPALLDAYRGTGHLDYTRYAILPLPAFAAMLAALPGWVRSLRERTATPIPGSQPPPVRTTLDYATPGARRPFPRSFLLYLLPLAACGAAALSLSPVYGSPRDDLSLIAHTLDADASANEPIVFTGNERPPYVPRTLMLVYAHFHAAGPPHPILICKTTPLPSPDTLAALRATASPSGRIWAVTLPEASEAINGLPGFTLERTQRIIGLAAVHRLTVAR